jgi:hypothetical protein
MFVNFDHQHSAARIHNDTLNLESTSMRNGVLETSAWHTLKIIKFVGQNHKTTRAVLWPNPLSPSPLPYSSPDQVFCTRPALAGKGARRWGKPSLVRKIARASYHTNALSCASCGRASTCHCSYFALSTNIHRLGLVGASPRLLTRLHERTVARTRTLLTRINVPLL